MFQTSTVFSTDTKTQFFFRGKACTKKSYTHKHTHRASRQMLHNTLYTALNQRSPGQGQELNLRASITFSKTQLILCLSTTNTHTEHLFPLSHSFALFPTLHSMQRAHDCERKSACMYACVCGSLCVFICLCLHCDCDGVLGDIVCPNRGLLPCVSAQGLSLRLRLWSQLLPAAPESSTLPE